MMTMTVNTNTDTDSNNSIEEAMALHREALDLRDVKAKRQRYQLDLTRLRTDINEDEDDNQASHDGLSDEQMKRSRLRNQVIAEICSTERTYVRDIRTLHDYYIVPLEDNKHPIMEDAQIAVFFNNLRQLVMLNSKLLNDLLDIVDKRTKVLKYYFVLLDDAIVYGRTGGGLQKKKFRLIELWECKSISLATAYHGAQPEETLSIGLCEAVPMKELTFFRIYVRTDTPSQQAVDRQAYTFETQSSAEREEWLRAINHCISGSAMTHIVEMRRRSLNSATLAPIFMFDKSLRLAGLWQLFPAQVDFVCIFQEGVPHLR
ncbi:hypothetical protein ATCC90586_009123 [Pythium insidiosum]|nr:hypothetical protein ATCC90586_009123 [Pythium insidiosum]